VRVQVLQHVPFEGIGSIQKWMDARGAEVSTTRFFEPSALPKPRDLDWLIVMGGPMSVNDESVHTWLPGEKRLIAQAIQAGKTVLGICLGAQLIASALGARVFPNQHKEIGWFPVRRSPGGDLEIARLFEDGTEVFHWHGETFDLPSGAVGFLHSDACRNQAFVFGSRVVGLQFHIETTPLSAASLIENSRDELVSGPYVHTEAEMLARPERFARANALMDEVLESLLPRTRADRCWSSGEGLHGGSA
jgi:GMP synthase-like glutamine amidotransferase